MTQANTELHVSESPSADPISALVIDRFRRLCEVLPLAVLETDVEESLLYANPRWEEISGQREAESRGQGWRDAIHPADQEWVLEEAELARGQDRMFDADFRINRPDGRECWVHGRSLPLYSGQGGHDGFLHMIYDISDRKLIEAKLRDSLAEMAVEQGRERAEVSGAARQVKDSLTEASELAYGLRQANGGSPSPELIDRLCKCLDNALAAGDILPDLETVEVEDPSLADILF